jgi:Arabinose-binding domain of AraC transcription regulator, N-term
MDPATLRDRSARISSDTFDGVMERVAALIPDPAFALRAARCWHPSNLDALGYAWLTSSTLRIGLQRLERFTRILGERARVRITNGRDGLRLSGSPTIIAGVIPCCRRSGPTSSCPSSWTCAA